MPKSNELIINAPRQGIAQSPHVGFADVRNLDIFTIPGIARLNNILAKKSSTTVDAQIKWFARNPNSPANIYAIDSNGSVYNSANSGATWAELSDRAGAGEGLIVWKDYLFVFETTTIDTYGPLSGTPAWTDNWQTIGTAAWHPAYISKNDGKLYFGCNNYLGSIEEVSGQNFDDDTASTYTVKLGTSASNALDLPEDYKIKCLEELRNYLMIGTWKGTNVYDIKVADIFPWDRAAVSFEEPIQINEYGVHAMLTVGNYIYVMAGIEGIVYKTNGVSAYPVARIPNSIADITGGKYLEPYPNAIANYKGRPFFAVSGSNVADGIGVYSLMETSAGTILNLEHVISQEVYGSANPTVIGALLPITRDTLLVGWRDNATYGIDLTTATSYAYTTNYTGYFDSPLYKVGTNLVKRQFSEIEFQLAKELAANEGIKISFRINLTDSFTKIGTYTTANIGTGVISHNEKVNIPNCEFIQIRVALLGTSTTTPEFKSVTLR